MVCVQVSPAPSLMQSWRWLNLVFMIVLLSSAGTGSVRGGANTQRKSEEKAVFSHFAMFAVAAWDHHG